VKWENYDEKLNTWEPEANLDNVKEMIKKFERKQK
jgi:hypothetical protein